MDPLPFTVRFELAGWELFWAHLEAGEEPAAARLDQLRTTVVAEVRRRLPDRSALASHPPIVALRSLFKQAGCDPSRYRPSSEALLRRLVKGGDLPAIHPLVDVNNCLSADQAVPCCVMRDGSFGTALVYRAGRAKESYQSLRGPFNLEAKPVLYDEQGPLDAPITGNERVKVLPESRSAWLVAYLPGGEVSADAVWRSLHRFASQAGVAATRYPSST